MLLKSHAHSERRLLAAGATLTVVGIAMSTGDATSLASVFTIGGLLALIVGLHRFGRTGPDQTVPAEPRANSQRTPARKKSRPRA
jgi:uncharacterized protein (DUF58 family)